jgi:hypothetical protein
MMRDESLESVEMMRDESLRGELRASREGIEKMQSLKSEVEGC